MVRVYNNDLGDRDSIPGQVIPKTQKCHLILFTYLPTPPLGQDMTQGQFLSGV